jgi:uncharacterized RDD family membrane protein YckC
MQPEPLGYNPYAPPAAPGPRFPEPEEDRGYQPLATRGSRLGARLLDGLLDLGVAIPGAIMMFSAMAERPDAGPDVEAMYPAIGVMMVGLLPLSIYQWYLLSTRGHTLGKKWLGIRVVRNDGTPVDFVRGVILRNWVLQAIAQIPYIGSFIGLVDTLMIFGGDQRCLHDKIADTKVIAVLPGSG